MICCSRPTIMCFKVFALAQNSFNHTAPDLYEETDLDKSFFISLQESQDINKKFGYPASPQKISPQAIIVKMFDSLFGWDIGPNGFYLHWKYVGSKIFEYEVGYIYWYARGVHWRIERVV